MRKKKYNLRLKSTKKQKITLGIMFAVAFIIQLVSLSVEEPSDLFSIICLILLFIDLFTCLIIILVDNGKEVKKAKKAQDKLYDDFDSLATIMNKKLDEVYSHKIIDCEKEDKINLILCALRTVCEWHSNIGFYTICSDLTLDEINDLISDIKFSKDFKYYWENVLMKFKESNEILKFRYEFTNILENRLAGVPQDEKLFSDNVYYNNLKYIRSYYVYDEKSKKYEVFSEMYSDNYGYNRWDEFISSKKYAKKESAINRCKYIVNKYNYKKYVFEDPKDMDITELRRSVVGFRLSENRLEEPYQSLAEYYTRASKVGHKAYFEEKEMNMVQILRILEAHLPQVLFDAVILAYNYKENIDLVTKADNLLKEHEKEIEDKIYEYADIIDIRIIPNDK